LPETSMRSENRTFVQFYKLIPTCRFDMNSGKYRRERLAEACNRYAAGCSGRRS